MTLTESELLQARIAKMSNLEFDEWLQQQLDPHVNEAYQAGREDGFAQGYNDGYQVAKEEYQE